jgi:hypothetical protein
LLENVEEFRYMEITSTNTITSLNLSSSCLLSKKLKIEIEETVILPADIIYEYETSCLTPEEELTLKIFERKECMLEYLDKERM